MIGDKNKRPVGGNFVKRKSMPVNAQIQPVNRFVKKLAMRQPGALKVTIQALQIRLSGQQFDTANAEFSRQWVIRRGIAELVYQHCETLTNVSRKRLSRYKYITLAPRYLPDRKSHLHCARASA
jgi:hypothetical protein